ncbi:MAG: hypothetical protein WCZ89_04440 [Phycisphaerae bacterium]
MMDTETKRKIGADKIFLLGLFALSLLIAHIIVKSRTGIILSSPIELPNSGLSIPLPEKNGWQTQKNWRYEQNNFTLNAFFKPGIAGVSANVQCTYVLADERESIQVWLEQRAREYLGNIKQQDQKQVGDLKFDWILLSDEQDYANILIATAQLPHGRWLDIEILDTTLESNEAVRIFKAVVSGINFENNELLAAGIEAVEYIKNTGLNSLVETQEEVRYFLIKKDAGGEDMGFSMEYTLLTEANRSIEMVGYLYVKSQRAREEASLFQSDSHIDRFFWNSKASNGRISSSVELNLTERYILTEIGTTAQGFERRHFLSKAAIPRAVMETLFKILFKQEKTSVIVDIIYSQGMVRPVLVTLETKIENSKTVHLAKVQHLENLRNGEEYYFDDQMILDKIIIRQDTDILLERSTMDELLQKFPEREDVIIERSQSFESRRNIEKPTEDNRNETIRTI